MTKMAGQQDMMEGALSCAAHSSLRGSLGRVGDSGHRHDERGCPGTSRLFFFFVSLYTAISTRLTFIKARVGYQYAGQVLSPSRSTPQIGSDIPPMTSATRFHPGSANHLDYLLSYLQGAGTESMIATRRGTHVPMLPPHGLHVQLRSILVRNGTSAADQGLSPMLSSCRILRDQWTYSSSQHVRLGFGQAPLAKIVTLRTLACGPFVPILCLHSP